uniref:G domain-containing protein n=1 Tax=Poecilia reticulata TaxID=8081 RepID=A0A3P9PUH0_POERE
NEPWRELSWGQKQNDLQYVQQYKPEKDDIRYLRILLYGPVGAGKSSFINTVSNVLRGRMTIPALASATTSDKNRGVYADDIKLALRGHVKEDHKVQQLHEQMKSSVLEKMKSVREAASDLGIPQMAMMTHIDEACSETEKDLRTVYKSKYLKKKMKDFSSAVEIPMNCIFPVKNYSEEIDMNDDIDALILSALRNMINFGDDFIEKI